MKLWKRFESVHRSAQHGRPTTAFHAVSIQYNLLHACDLVQKEQGKRYLSAEAPTLPLEGCECQLDCRCRYKHFSDRRSGPRRLADLGLEQQPMPAERRQQRERRQAAS